MKHPKLAAWDKELQQVFFQVDHYLEDRYGESFDLHPRRPRRGSTSNPQMDGLFNIGASFSPGFGSEQGRGYVIDVHIATLDKVPAEFREKIIQEAVGELQNLLDLHFPLRDLKVVKDGDLYKIIGDFSLGSL